jgi:hypothetical protein
LLVIGIYREDDIWILTAQKFRIRIDWTDIQNETGNEIPAEKWPFDFPILEGWPPGKFGYVSFCFVVVDVDVGGGGRGDCDVVVGCGGDGVNVAVVFIGSNDIVLLNVVVG